MVFAYPPMVCPSGGRWWEVMASGHGLELQRHKLRATSAETPKGMKIEKESVLDCAFRVKTMEEPSYPALILAGSHVEEDILHDWDSLLDHIQDAGPGRKDWKSICHTLASSGPPRRLGTANWEDNRSILEHTGHSEVMLSMRKLGEVLCSVVPIWMIAYDTVRWEVPSQSILALIIIYHAWVHELFLECIFSTMAVAVFFVSRWSKRVKPIPSDQSVEVAVEFIDAVTSISRCLWRMGHILLGLAAGALTVRFVSRFYGISELTAKLMGFFLSDEDLESLNHQFEPLVMFHHITFATLCSLFVMGAYSRAAKTASDQDPSSPTTPIQNRNLSFASAGSFSRDANDNTDTNSEAGAKLAKDIPEAGIRILNLDASKGWSKSSDNDGYKLETKTVSWSSIKAVRISTEVKCHITSLAEWLSVDENVKSIDVMLDNAERLDTLLDTPTLATVNAYACFKSGVLGVSKRDFVNEVSNIWLQETGDGIQMASAPGSGLFVQCATSITLPSHPPKRGIVRGEAFGFGFLARTKRPGVIELKLVLSMDPKGWLPPVAIDIANKNQLDKMKKLKGILEKLPPPSTTKPEASQSPSVQRLSGSFVDCANA